MSPGTASARTRPAGGGSRWGFRILAAVLVLLLLAALAAVVTARIRTDRMAAAADQFPAPAQWEADTSQWPREVRPFPVFACSDPEGCGSLARDWWMEEPVADVEVLASLVEEAGYSILSFGGDCRFDDGDRPGDLCHVHAASGDYGISVVQGVLDGTDSYYVRLELDTVG